MTPKEEKVEAFLGQFQDAWEFLQWCEVQGVKGRIGVSTQCLVARAIERATGVDVAVANLTPSEDCPPFADIAGMFRVREEGCVYRPMPSKIAHIPFFFDMQHHPHLVEAPLHPKG